MKLLIFTSLIFGLSLNLFAQDSAILSSDKGRYVFSQVSQTRADQYLLDTKTGKMWNIVADKDGNKKLEPIPIIDMYFNKETNKLNAIELYEPIGKK